MSSSLRTSQVPPVAGEEMLSEVVVVLPPGLVGIRFRKDSCPPLVSEVMDTCPVSDKINVGDTISSLILPDKTMLDDLTSAELVKTLAKHKDSSRRKLVVVTTTATIEKAGGVEIPLADATEVSERPLPTDKEHFTQNNLLQVLVLVFTLLAFFLSIGGTASCRYVQSTIGGVGGFFGSGDDYYNDGYSSGSQSFGSQSYSLGFGLFRSDIGGTCIKNGDPGSDNIVLYFAQAGAVISCILSGISVFLFIYAIFDHTKWSRRCNHILVNFAFFGALLSFTMFASCACGVCTSGESFAVGLQSLFSCKLASGANQFIAASFFYLSASIMLCFTRAPTAPLINCGDCRCQ